MVGPGTSEEPLSRRLRRLENLDAGSIDVACGLINRWTPLRPFIEELRHHEALMLRLVPSYKEHLVHMMKVWLTGRYILSHEPEGGRSVGRLLAGLVCASPVPLPVQPDRQGRLLNGLWSLVALSHDCGRCYEELGRWANGLVAAGLRTRSERNSRSAQKDDANDVKPEIALHRLLASSRTQRHFESLAGAVGNRAGVPSSAWLLAQLYSQLANARHGVLSSLVVATNMQEPLDNEFWRAVSRFVGAEREREKLTEGVLTQATAAIALHHWTRWWKREGESSEDPAGTVLLSEMPLLFLLAFCDLLQETGRACDSARREPEDLVDVDWADAYEKLEVSVRDGRMVVDGELIMPFPYAAVAVGPPAPMVHTLQGILNRARALSAGGPREGNVRELVQKLVLEAEATAKTCEDKAAETGAAAAVSAGDEAADKIVQRMRLVATASALKKIAEALRFKLLFMVDRSDVCFHLVVRFRLQGADVPPMTLCLNGDATCGLA